MENESLFVLSFIRDGSRRRRRFVRSGLPVMPDEDAPELTLEQYAEMAAMARNHRSQRVKPVAALRISPETPEKAKATGKGCAGFLSRLPDNAINDPQIVAKSL